MWERIKHMLIKEFIQMFRDPRMKGVIFLMPIVQLLVFGYAVTTELRMSQRSSMIWTTASPAANS
jgi:ABC-2 type transport system permease protein